MKEWIISIFCAVFIGLPLLGFLTWVVVEHEKRPQQSYDWREYVETERNISKQLMRNDSIILARPNYNLVAYNAEMGNYFSSKSDLQNTAKGSLSVHIMLEGLKIQQKYIKR